LPQSADDPHNHKPKSYWFPSNNTKQTPIVIEDSDSEIECVAEVAGQSSESYGDCHEAYSLDTFYDYIKDEENPNIMLIRDTILKTRFMSIDEFEDVLKSLDLIIEDEENPNIMLNRDTILKTRVMSIEEFDNVLNYLDSIID
jgi:hypothetical protein